jgi:glycosyltransferase involved in cell wall biosynthesis
MRIILVHNYYQQPGGEDTVFHSLSSLLDTRGHIVTEYVDDNQRISNINPAVLAVQTIWSGTTYSKIKKLIRKVHPDVIHFYNVFPLISPSVYYACREEGIPVIQSLDNPRLLCPSANFYRNEKLCMECANKLFPLPGIIHACYRNSRIQTAVVGAMLSTHKMLKTWQNQVNLYLVATNFYKNIFISYGFPAQKIEVRPHFISEDPGIGVNKIGGYALFLARLDPEKGVRTLLKAWKNLDVPLKIRGSGKLDQEVSDYILESNKENLELVERLPVEKLRELIKSARFLVWPSEGYYETFGMAAVECYASGIPVIAARIGVMMEIVHDGVTGLLFNPGDPDDLAKKVSWLWSHPEECLEMGRNARRVYEEKYTSELYYEELIQIYQRVIVKSQGIAFKY